MENTIKKLNKIGATFVGKLRNVNKYKFGSGFIFIQDRNRELNFGANSSGSLNHSDIDYSFDNLSQVIKFINK